MQWSSQHPSNNIGNYIVNSPIKTYHSPSVGYSAGFEQQQPPVVGSSATHPSPSSTSADSAILVFLHIFESNYPPIEISDGCLSVHAEYLQIRVQRTRFCATVYFKDIFKMEPFLQSQELVLYTGATPHHREYLLEFADPSVLPLLYRILGTRVHERPKMGLTTSLSAQYVESQQMKKLFSTMPSSASPRRQQSSLLVQHRSELQVAADRAGSPLPTAEGNYGTGWHRTSAPRASSLDPQAQQDMFYSARMKDAGGLNRSPSPTPMNMASGTCLSPDPPLWLLRRDMRIKVEHDRLFHRMGSPPNTHHHQYSPFTLTGTEGRPMQMEKDSSFAFDTEPPYRVPKPLTLRRDEDYWKDYPPVTPPSYIHEGHLEFESRQQSKAVQPMTRGAPPSVRPNVTAANTPIVSPVYQSPGHRQSLYTPVHSSTTERNGVIQSTISTFHNDDVEPTPMTRQQLMSAQESNVAFAGNTTVPHGALHQGGSATATTTTSNNENVQRFRVALPDKPAGVLKSQEGNRQQTANISQPWYRTGGPPSQQGQIATPKKAVSFTDDHSPSQPQENSSLSNEQQPPPKPPVRRPPTEEQSNTPAAPQTQSSPTEKPAEKKPPPPSQASPPVQNPPATQAPPKDKQPQQSAQSNPQQSPPVCRHCGNTIQGSTTLQEHEARCPNRKLKCQTCGMAVMAKDTAKHKAECGAAQSKKPPPPIQPPSSQQPKQPATEALQSQSGPTTGKPPDTKPPPPSQAPPPVQNPPATQAPPKDKQPAAQQPPNQGGPPQTKPSAPPSTNKKPPAHPPTGSGKMKKLPPPANRPPPQH